MDKKDLRIVYMGTPDFAVPTLEKLIDTGYNIVGVVTMPDKPIGRHQNQLQASPVKQCALRHGIQVLQPDKLKDEAFLTDLRALQADLQIVVAFRMLPEVVWNMPRLGTFNLHAALLPQYRGAAPINWAIINGDTQTGITTFFLDHHIDTGQVIQQEAIPIGPDDNAQDIHDRLMMLGADLVCQTVQDICNGTIRPIPQEQMTTTQPLRPAPKIFRDTCQIHWDRHTAQTAHNFVRGLSPSPGAWTAVTLPDGRETTVKILATKITGTSTSHSDDGTVTLTSHDNRLLVRMTGGTLEITQLQAAGKKRMAAADFLNGTDIQGWTLT